LPPSKRAPSSRPAQKLGAYDHLAGPLGVALYRDLLERGTLRDHPGGTVEIADRQALVALGVGDLEPRRRRLAFECIDATEHAPHLAGALASALIERRWVERDEGRNVRSRPPASAASATSA
jgi:hypothetical protein